MNRVARARIDSLLLLLELLLLGQRAVTLKQVVEAFRVRRVRLRITAVARVRVGDARISRCPLAEEANEIEGLLLRDFLWVRFGLDRRQQRLRRQRVLAARTREARRALVLLQLRIDGRNILQAVLAELRVDLRRTVLLRRRSNCRRYLVRQTVATSDLQAVPAKVCPRDRTPLSAAAFVQHAIRAKHSRQLKTRHGELYRILTNKSQQSEATNSRQRRLEQLITLW